jgi:hypothetical protein
MLLSLIRMIQAFRDYQRNVSELSQLRTAVTTTESDLAGGPCDDLTRIGGIPGIGQRQYAGRHDRHASDSTEMGVRRLEAR